MFWKKFDETGKCSLYGGGRRQGGIHRAPWSLFYGRTGKKLTCVGNGGLWRHLFLFILSWIFQILSSKKRLILWPKKLLTKKYYKFIKKYRPFTKQSCNPVILFLSWSLYQLKHIINIYRRGFMPFWSTS